MKKIQELFTFICLFSSFLIIGNSHVPIHQEKYKFVSVDYILKKYSDITYKKHMDVSPFCYKPFSLSQWPDEQPWIGNFAETFIMTVPGGKVSSSDGLVLIDDHYMLRELTTVCRQFYFYVNLVLWNNFGTARKVPGRVAVLAKQHTECYGHWLIEILGRLIILEKMGIEYDWLYVPQDKKFMKETLQLWGIKQDKIIEPLGEFHFIEADELIIPSIPSRRSALMGETFNDINQLCLYCPDFVIESLRNKFIPMTHVYNNKMPKRIYISRADNKNGRGIINEDEIFELLSQYGFEKRILSEMPFLEQVALFNQAEIIIGPNGSGLTNTMFCNENALIVEIFQGRSDSTFYNIIQTLKLKYIPIKTQEFTGTWGHESTHVHRSIIKKLIIDLGL